MNAAAASRQSGRARKRIAIISPALPPLACGEAMSTYFTAVKLAESGVDVHVLTTRRHLVADVPGATVHADMERWSWTELPGLVRRLRRLKPDGVLLLYMAAMYERHPMITFLPSVVRRVLPSTRLVTRFEHVDNGLPDPAQASWPGRLARRAAIALVGAAHVDTELGTLIRDSDAVIALCWRHGEQVRERCPKLGNKVVIVPPAATLAVAPDVTGAHRRRGRDRIGARPSDVVVGYMGYVYPEKGIEDLLAAFASTTRRADLRLVVLGGRIGAPGTQFFAYFDRMQELASDLGLGDRVAWSGEFPHDDDGALPAYFHSVDFWVLPFVHGAHLNNSSLTSLLTHGCAVVTTRSEPAEEALVDGENVLLVPRRDRAALCEAIDRLTGDLPLRDRLAGGAVRLGRERLSWPAAIERTLSALLGPRSSKNPSAA